MTVLSSARLLGAATLALFALPAAAQHRPRPDTTNRSCTPEHAAMGHCTMPAEVSSCTPEHAAMGHCTMPSSEACAMPGGMDSMESCPMHASMTHGGGATTLPSAPMTRDASGTSWNPDASPMEALHGTLGGWTTMLHGAASPRITAQDVFDAGSRGATKFSLPNWAMASAHRPIGAAHLTLRAMLSLDPLTEGKRGYPLLFQTGEAVGGAPLVDEQHPHDLIPELSATVAVPVGETSSVFGYVAYPGEPAIGPTAFMHRPSARTLPDAPLSHHWQDATHIVFGVATLGAVVGPVKLDASLFTGREPDEDRYMFDRARFDSYSGRVTFAPNANWTMQASAGFIRSPEALHEDLDIVRTTASVIYARPTPTGVLTGALVWGYNAARENGEATDDHSGHSLLAEADLARGPFNVFGRAELVQKGADELNVTLPGNAHGHALNVGALTLGAARTVAHFGVAKAQLGASGTVYAVPTEVRSAYGDFPVSAQAFLRIVLDGGSSGHAGMNH